MAEQRQFDWYDFGALFSRNGVFNMVVGARGVGKTYSAKKKVIRDFLRQRKQFIYLRRYSSELVARNTFFADVGGEFPDHEFRIQGHEAQWKNEEGKWETMGWFIALSKAQTRKSSSFPNVYTIIFDEFILEKGYARYLPDETAAFMGFYSTVDRSNDRVRVLMLANAVSIMNPYFTDWNVSPDHEWWSSKDGFVVAHFPNSSTFKEQVSQTRFGQFIVNTSYGDYAIGNEFGDNSEVLIGEKSPEAIYAFTMLTHNGRFSAWIDREVYPNVWYVSSKASKDPTLVVMDEELMDDDTILLERQHRLLQRFRAAFNRGDMKFDSPRIRNAVSRVFKR